MTPPNEQVDPESSGIPAEAEAQSSNAGTLDDGDQAPLANPPSMDFWQAVYSRRSIRRFKPDPVPRELVNQVLHAGIWAPSSCNYQMWDLVVVDDPQINLDLAQVSSQLGNAPVNIVVAYGRGFSEENYANVQSAAALIENMSLAAGVLGLGSFWITQVGDGRLLGAKVGLPPDRWVVAVLALGYPKSLPKKGPKRRPLSQVTHYNHYAGRAIPSSVDPDAWAPDLLAIYQRARVLNGLRHNKPRPWEVPHRVGPFDFSERAPRRHVAMGEPLGSRQVNPDVAAEVLLGRRHALLRCEQVLHAVGGLAEVEPSRTETACDSFG